MGHENKLSTGLIAQEVEEASKSLGYDFSVNVQPQSEKGYYSLRYSDLVVPLINAVQIPSRQNEELALGINELKNEVLLLSSDNQ